MSKFFVISAVATQVTSAEAIHMNVNHSTGFCEVEDKEEAERLALEGTLKRYPVEDGWAGHSVAAVEVKQEVLEAVVANMQADQKVASYLRLADGDDEPERAM
jgi:hypothetical protein